MSAGLARLRPEPDDDRDVELAAIRERCDALERRLDRELPKDEISLVCFSGEWDRLFAAFVIANGALAMGQRVNMFFTFWAAAALRDRSKSAVNRTFLERILGSMLPSGAESAPLSRMNFGGLGKAILRSRLRLGLLRPGAGQASDRLPHDGRDNLGP
jgi:hypothetical protein